MLRRRGVEIWVIGVGKRINQEELERIAGEKDHFRHVESFAKLETLVTEEMTKRSKICSGKFFFLIYAFCVQGQ